MCLDSPYRFGCACALLWFSATALLAQDAQPAPAKAKAPPPALGVFIGEVVRHDTGGLDADNESSGFGIEHLIGFGLWLESLYQSNSDF